MKKRLKLAKSPDSSDQIISIDQSELRKYVQQMKQISAQMTAKNELPGEKIVKCGFEKAVSIL